MAKDLPYFKFIATEWLTGSIVYEPYELQGLFINICALYWQREGILSISEIEQRYKKKAQIAKLTDRFISVKDGFISIDFLNEQLIDRQYVSKKNSKNGKLGGRPMLEKNKPKQNPTESEPKAKKSNIEEEEEEEKNKKEKKKRKEEEQELPDGSYQKFLDIYSNWYENLVGVKIKFDGVQGKALKKIIAYLIANSKEKNAQGGADAWEYILLNWSKIDKFYQDQTKVNQIESNLPNILNQLKNGNSKAKPTNSQENINNIIDSMFQR